MSFEAIEHAHNKDVPCLVAGALIATSHGRGAAEALVTTRDLMTYAHPLFDQHEVPFSRGLETENSLPKPHTKTYFKDDIMTELNAIFPLLETDLVGDRTTAARPTLKRFEADLLRTAKVA